MGEEFSWVRARYSCTPFGALKYLLKGAEVDIEERNATLEASARVVFRLGPCDKTSFAVLREAGAAVASVEFRVTDFGIAALDDRAGLCLEGALSLSDETECRLKVGDKELTFWQFRKRALEALFFNFRP